jgi:ribosome-associated translation inhibitor RaiA
MKQREWVQNWLWEESTETDVERAGESTEKEGADMDLSLDSEQEVLNTGYTLEEIDQEIKNRSKVNRKLRRQLKRHKEKYKSYRDDAVEATGDEKSDLYVKAKEEQIKHDTKQDFLDKLSERKLFLQSLRLQHVAKQLEDPAGNVQGVEIDVGELSVEEISDAIHEAESSEDEAEFVMEEVERELDLGTGLDVSDIKEDVEEEEAARIDEETSELEEGVESEIDREIEERLSELDDEFDE